MPPGSAIQRGRRRDYHRPRREQVPLYLCQLRPAHIGIGHIDADSRASGRYRRLPGVPSRGQPHLNRSCRYRGEFLSSQPHVQRMLTATRRTRPMPNSRRYRIRPAITSRKVDIAGHPYVVHARTIADRSRLAKTTTT
jgi:hypothetical protein